MKSISNIRQYILKQNKPSYLLNRISFKTFSTNAKIGKIITLPEDGDLDKILKESTTPVIIDFYADWCPPCKKLGPLLESSFNKHKNFTLVKENVDTNSLESSKYNVSGIPHVELVNKEKRISKFVGFDEKALSGMLSEIDKVSKL